MIQSNKKIHKEVIGYAFLLACLFVFTLRSFSIETIVSNSRVALLLIVAVLGYFAAKNKVHHNNVVNSAFVMGTYMSIVYVVEKGINMGAASTILSNLLWVLVIYQLMRMEISEKDLQIISYLMTATCNICALIYINNYTTWVTELDGISAVGAINSIYYILTLMPFLFFIEKRWQSVLAYVIPLIAIIVSGKTTCLLCSLAIIVYMFWGNLKAKGGLQTTIFMILVGICAYLYIKVYKSDVTDNISMYIAEDIDSGGNGRLEIWQDVLSYWFTDENLFRMIFGHGFNSISKKIGMGGHNDFLEMLYCYGLIGLTLLLYFLKIIVAQLKRLKKEDNFRNSFVVSLVVFFFSIFASKLLSTQIGMIPLALYWGIFLSRVQQKQIV